MEFKKWHKIENTDTPAGVKNLAHFLETHPELESETYVILEKLHGSNFQWHFLPGEPVRAGSRNQYLDTVGSFQGASIPKLMADNEEIIAHLQELANSGSQSIRLFGELVGRGIGKGVDYGEEKRILYFGMMIDDQLLPFRELDLQSLPLRLRLAPILAKVIGLQEALDFNTKFDSMILGVIGNICEGVVIQPYAKVYYDQRGTSPFILKKKNDEFKEKEKAKKVRVVDTEVERLNAEFVLYITGNRLQSVFSKHGEIESPKQIGNYIRFVLEDAKEEFLKDFSDDIAATSKAQQKQIFNVGSAIANMLKAYL